jgi:hypothetical protein
METPNLDFKEVFVVEDWNKEIKKGVGIYFSQSEDPFDEFANCWFVWFDVNQPSPKRYLNYKVFDDEIKANNELTRLKNIIIKQLRKQIDDNNNLINKIYEQK